MVELSPEAQKAIENAQIRTTFWWPKLGRTGQKLVILRPPRGGGRNFAAFMADRLPMFSFNHEKNWWEAALVQANYKIAVEVNSVKLNRTKREVQLVLSAGVKTWAKD